jgi:hypothetical protein
MGLSPFFEKDKTCQFPTLEGEMDGKYLNGYQEN